jgi:leader peptidase (prepilin peptidase)/N-methyltransferase
LDPVFAVAIFVLGLAFGSFLNVCIHRLPRGMSVVTPSSKCPKCNSPLKLYDNVPVLGWLLLKGRCRHCHASISPRYVVVEVLTAALFLLCYAKLGLTLAALKCCVFGFLLLGLIFTDAETKLLPDRLTLPGLALGLLFSLLVPVNDLATQLLPGIVFLPVPYAWHLFSLADALVGAAVGASFIYGAGAIYMRWRGVEGMGFGDVKLMAMVGAFLGLRLTVLTLFTATLAGSIFGVATMFVVWAKRLRRRILRNHDSGPAARRRAWQSASMVYRYYQMPFGVFLGSMALLAFFFGNHFLRWYWGQI